MPFANFHILYGTYHYISYSEWAKTHQSVHYLKNHPLSRLLNGFQAYFLLVQTARNFLFTLKQGVKTWEQTQMSDVNFRFSVINLNNA